MSIGSELAHARERAGKSREQIAAATKIQLRKIEALERGVFTALPDGIYLDGIVRAYAKEVGLDGRAGDDLVRRLHLDSDISAEVKSVPSIASEYSPTPATLPPPAESVGSVAAPSRLAADDSQPSKRVPPSVRRAPAVVTAPEEDLDQLFPAEAELSAPPAARIAAPSYRMPPSRSDAPFYSASGPSVADVADDLDGDLDASDALADKPLIDWQATHHSPVELDADPLFFEASPAVTSGPALAPRPTSKTPARLAAVAALVAPLVGAALGFYLLRDQTSTAAVSEEVVASRANNAAAPEQSSARAEQTVAAADDSRNRIEERGVFAVDRTEIARDEATVVSPKNNAGATATSSPDAISISAAPNSAAPAASAVPRAAISQPTPDDPAPSAVGRKPAPSNAASARTTAASRGPASRTPAVARRTPAPPAAPGRTAVVTRGTRPPPVPAAAASVALLPATPLAPPPPGTATDRSPQSSGNESASDAQVQTDRRADVSGAWDFTTVIESASVPDYEGMRLGYRVQLAQSGGWITGSGYKLTENGASVGRAARTPIRIQGSNDGRRLNLTFTEQGTRRASQGKFVLDLVDEGLLQGRFSSDAARSQGTLRAKRAQ